MASENTIQTAVWQIELGRGRIAVYWVLAVLFALGLALVFTASEFRGLDKREAMDQAQLARNLARGQGFTTYVIRPLSLWHLQNFSPDKDPRLLNHPDLANAPLYPLVLSAMFRLLPASVFDSRSDDRIYPPVRWVIVPFNQICLLLSLVLVYFWARSLFDHTIALTAALLLLLSDVLWQFSISGLASNFLMLLFLGTLYCLHRADLRLNPPGAEPAALSAAALGWILAGAVLLALCFLTRYLAGVLVFPLAWYVWRITRSRRAALWALLFTLVFLVGITPWLVRNYNVSGSFLGVAKYEYAQNTGPLNFDALPRSYQPNAEGALDEATAFSKLTSRFLNVTRQQFFQTLPRTGSWLLLAFFAVGVMYRFRRADVVGLRGLLASERQTENEIFGDNLLVLFVPLITVYGVAFFYLLLERIPFRIRLTRGLAIAAFAAVNVAPIVYTLLPPRKPAYAYPPYLPPVLRAVAGWFDKEELGCSDLPWAVAWYGDRRCLWLPLTVKDFYDIHDFGGPPGFKGISFMLLTPYMLDRPLNSQLFKGEYAGWATVIRGRMPPEFPLKALTALPPGTDQILFADRPRWKDQQLAEPDLTPHLKRKPAPPPESPPAVGTPAPVTE
jgi:hypothetical protein